MGHHWTVSSSARTKQPYIDSPRTTGIQFPPTNRCPVLVQHIIASQRRRCSPRRLRCNWLPGPDRGCNFVELFRLFSAAKFGRFEDVLSIDRPVIKSERVTAEAQWLSSSVSRFHTTGSGLKSRVGKGRLSLSSLQWVDKLSTKLTCKLNTGGFTSDLPFDQNICTCIPAPKVTKAERGTTGLGPHGWLHH
ncbi:hypothetical protein TNCV_3293101 [Trichonephila clavipes]|nr:hypothetical protein TNCV_3293101 [Trichonephila clavipes]